MDCNCTRSSHPACWVSKFGMSRDAKRPEWVTECHEGGELGRIKFAGARWGAGTHGIFGLPLQRLWLGNGDPGGLFVLKPTPSHDWKLEWR